MPKNIRPPDHQGIQSRLKRAISNGNKEMFPAIQREPFDYVDVAPIKPYRTKDPQKKSWEHDGGIHFQWGIKGWGFGEA